MAYLMTFLQGFVEVYRGPERSYKVTKLQPGIRYTSRVQVRGADVPGTMFGQ